MKQIWFTCPRCGFQMKADAHHNHHCRRCNHYPMLMGKVKPQLAPRITRQFPPPTPSGTFPPMSGPVPPQMSGPLPPYGSQPPLSGQFSQAGYPPPNMPPPRASSLEAALANFRRMPPFARWALLGFVLVVICGCIGIAAASGGNNSNTAAATATPGYAATNAPQAQAPNATKVLGSPTATNTPKPTATSTPKPSPTPSITVQFTCAEGVDYSYAKVCVHTLPGAQLNIAVVYCSGRAADSASLKGTKTADGNGNYEWDWVPNTVCKGNVGVDVAASLGNLFDDEQTNFILG